VTLFVCVTVHVCVCHSVCVTVCDIVCVPVRVCVCHSVCVTECAYYFLCLSLHVRVTAWQVLLCACVLLSVCHHKCLCPEDFKISNLDKDYEDFSLSN
jgi:hypothetical protein